MTELVRSNGLLERLEQGPVICAEGYLFELERRGYLQAGAFVPEVVLEHPELVEQLHREFVHAGSDVVEAFTYYGHREKMRIVGKEHLLEDLNRQALALAREVADETGTLFAGDICNTNVFDPDDDASKRAVRAMFEEQVGWAADAGVDLVIAETFSRMEARKGSIVRGPRMQLKPTTSAPACSSRVHASAGARPSRVNGSWWMQMVTTAERSAALIASSAIRASSA